MMMEIDSDSDAPPEEVTFQDGFKQDEEISNAVRIAHEQNEQQRTQAPKETPRKSKGKVVNEVTETEPHEEAQDKQGMLPNDIVNLLAAREKSEPVILKDIPSAQCVQNSVQALPFISTCGLLKMAMVNRNWECMIKRWSLDEGTHDHRPSGPQWRESIKKYLPPPEYHIADRLFDIADSFEDEIEDEIEVKTNEDLLDELQAYVDFVDVAKVLHSDERLFPFLHYVLPNKHAGIRAKGAEVVTTMVENNPTSQQLVIKEEGLKLLLQNFTSDPDATSRTKALVAISSLIWNNSSGIDEFQRESGNAALMNALISRRVCQREVLSVIQYLLREKRWDCNIVHELGLPYIMLHLRSLLVLARDDKLKQALQELISAMTQRDDAEVREAADRNSVSEKDCNIVTELGLPRIMIHLASSDDAEVREAALRGLLALTRDEGGNNVLLIKNDSKLKQVLFKLIKGISAMSPEDQGAAASEERQLVYSLWNACYNEPSSLKVFEPSLGACAADSNSVSEKNEAPLVPELDPLSVQCNPSLKKRKR